MRFQFAIVLAAVCAMTVPAAANDIDFSQFKGKAYEVVKHDLLAEGWELIPLQEGETSFSKQYPEVTCGSGSMAICSVGFRHKPHSVAFIVIESNDQLIIAEEY
ncbi:DUF4258 domain-containing protein [Vibrio neptunius]|uniref:hypothetical protein n=1 Tax=Vibrio neptunius TaxID=170651 RepID=UPI001C5C9B89|nr:hypothetical protein [Vibrio neptunius]QXX05876.1 hypothetical protein KW548_12000 [Vibrio neptunius]